MGTSQQFWSGRHEPPYQYHNVLGTILETAVLYTPLKNTDPPFTAVHSHMM